MSVRVLRILESMEREQADLRLSLDRAERRIDADDKRNAHAYLSDARSCIDTLDEALAELRTQLTPK